MEGVFQRVRFVLVAVLTGFYLKKHLRDENIALYSTGGLNLSGIIAPAACYDKITCLNGL